MSTQEDEAKKAQDQIDAEAKKAEAEAAKNANKAPGSRYFKSSKAGLKFLTTNGESVRFVPYFEKYQGDRIRVGYLEVTSKKLADRVAADAYTEEISAKAFKEATTGKDSQQAGY